MYENVGPTTQHKGLFQTWEQLRKASYKMRMRGWLRCNLNSKRSKSPLRHRDLPKIAPRSQSRTSLRSVGLRGNIREIRLQSLAQTWCWHSLQQQANLWQPETKHMFLMTNLQEKKTKTEKPRSVCKSPWTPNRECKRLQRPRNLILVWQLE